LSDLRLRKRFRLRKKREIKRCQNGGVRLYSKHFAVFACPSSSEDSRLAIAVTKKIEKRAVVRNKIKRRIREVFRLHWEAFREPTDIVVVARRGIQSCCYKDYEREILGALRSKGFFAGNSRD
jgi:ribonuclease P protein component